MIVSKLMKTFAHTRVVRRTLVSLVDRVSGFVHKIPSYSQFGEDAVMNSLLERLKHEADFVPIIRTYVDVGANVPIRHSNSYFLYCKGWRGILVEPMPRSRMSYRLNRRGDELVESCCGTSSGHVKFFTWFPHDVYNTTNALIAAGVQKRLNVAPREQSVPTVSLDLMISRSQVCREGVGILFIDVEGAELDVLRSLTLGAISPYVIVIEILGLDIGALLSTAVAMHLRNRGYSLYAWANPSLIFLRDDLSARLYHQ